MSLKKSKLVNALAIGLVLCVAVALEISLPQERRALVAQPAPAAMAAVAAPPPSTASNPLAPPVVRLTGVAMGPAGVGLALVSVDGAPATMVRVGDTLAGTGTVRAIGGDWLVYAHSAQEFRIRVQEGDALVSPTPTYAAGPAAVAAALPAASAQPANGNDDFRQAMAQKLASLKP